MTTPASKILYIWYVVKTKRLPVLPRSLLFLLIPACTVLTNIQAQLWAYRWWGKESVERVSLEVSYLISHPVLLFPVVHVVGSFTEQKYLIATMGTLLWRWEELKKEMQPGPRKQALWVDGGVFSTSYLTRMSCISNFDSCASLGWS